MPQINRIRVNNVKYNFGTQFYDDFLMRFSCKNTIYDLANGGGKSVLMLLLLQTVIPNCTLDEKQPVEKLFRTGNGSTTIHSLVEWRLDSCDVKNGFKYMTCGFCARKGRDNAEADTGEKESAGSANIDYFNYCIFYREFGDNDIKNLPLVNGRERITYNGLKNYLKELERKDFGVQVRIFERKGDYQSFINDYGIYESHWEIIRGINKTEGHVRAYFENNYRTTRKVVEDLLIEEIVEKSYNNRIRGGNSDDEMAKTLLDIKDKLLELARRRGDMEDYERQIKLIRDFSTRVGTFGEVYARKEAEKITLLSCLGRAKAQVAGQEKLTKELEEQTIHLRETLLEEEKLIALADIAGEEKELKDINELVEHLRDGLKTLTKEFEDCQRELCLAQTAEDYRDYLEHGNTLARLKEYMDNRHKDNAEITKELKQLASAKHIYTAGRLDQTEKSLKDLRNREQDSLEALNNLREDYRKRDNECALADGMLLSLRKQAENLEDSIKAGMEGTALLVSDRASEAIEELKDEYNKLLTKKRTLGLEEEELEKKQEYCIRELAAVQAEQSMQSVSMERLEEELNEARRCEEELSALGKVYGQQEPKQLQTAVERIYDDMLSDREAVKRELGRLMDYRQVIENGRPSESEGLRLLYEYIEGRYPGKAITGAEYLSRRSNEECRRLSEKFPYLPYSILAGEDYGLICSDRNIMGIDCGVVPLLPLKAADEIAQGEDSELSDNLSYNGEQPSLACLDISFIYDEAGRQAGIKKTEEELHRLRTEQDKLDDRLAVIRGDYEKIMAWSYPDRASAEELEQKLAKARKEYTAYEEKKDGLKSLANSLTERKSELDGRHKELEVRLTEVKAEQQRMQEIAKLNAGLNNCMAAISSCQADKEAAIKGRKLSQELLTGREKAYKEVVLRRTRTEETLEELRKRWELYEPYYNEIAADDNNRSHPETGGRLLPEEELDARFDALRQLISDEMGDLADKEKLMENCRTAMEKAKRAMQYRGIPLEEAVKLAENNELSVRSDGDILNITERQDKVRKEIAASENELDSASARMNRIEGGVAHARKSFTEHYGEYEEPDIANPAEFISQHKKEAERIREALGEAEKKTHENSRLCTGYMLMEKDLERIVKSMGYNPDEISASGEAVPEGGMLLNTKEYEEAGRRFENILKDEQRKKEAFLKERDMLSESLKALKAYELSEEIRRSVQVPANLAEAEALTAGLKDTADCIALERDRIGRGIEDMELIKDNFENRCVQICSNIRAELERLPKLSKITMDDEVIPILSLQIPYIKEEMYKDRMSVYINETVEAAENFKTNEEKLKYIKGRLTWKRLFSVIVTDMNSIRLNLYKRERIKDQSRYLRYEEAVGSTGQSQGIYIQFLVSVINYIANINAGGKEAAVLGKAIFIDNPFGAAKDVYIWEPIFKLLKTNHVQLIVPARGATPAITGRFDVNYVLGQKFADGRQQTVVVDYRSQTADAQIEYERLDFTQESFDFVEN